MPGPLRYGLAHALAAIGHAPASMRFQAALADPAAAQRGRLSRILRDNGASAFGRKHRFADLRTIGDFQRAVPVADYDDLAPWIDRTLHGEPGVLTSEPVLMFEKTSGSTRAAKYIPYTASLRAEFHEATAAWLYDLWRSRPALRRGGAYWSVSPAARAPERTPGGHPVGFWDDTEYLGPLTRWAMRRLLVVPPAVARIPDMAEFRRTTAQYLVARRHLALISVWNPTFLTLLIRDVQAAIGPFDAGALWPRLDLISCWTDAGAALFLPELRELFPGVTIQGKGLLSTEGVVSIPLVGHPGAALAVTSHFLEFVPAGTEAGPTRTEAGPTRTEAGPTLLADELETGARYRVLLTTGGGLYRYDTHDLIEVVGRVARTPLVRFLGKDDLVSDLCGEKLAGTHVERILADILPEGTRFALLSPETGPVPHYALLYEGPAAPDPAALDSRLRENPHYAYCRDLGQLAPPRALAVRDGQRKFLDGCVALGQKAGDVKPARLHRTPGWSKRLAGTEAGPTRSTPEAGPTRSTPEDGPTRSDSG